MALKKLRLLPRRKMQNVNTFSRFVGEMDEALGGGKRSRLVAPHRMGAWIAFDAQLFAIA
jgi:hypothetical protein